VHVAKPKKFGSRESLSAVRVLFPGVGRIYSRTMSSPVAPQSPVDSSGRCFATTRWSMVLAAQQDGTPASGAALATLCETYWYPLYSYVRRQGHQPAEAQDLTQAYFARLLEKNDLRDVARERGRFRNFLLASLKLFLSNQRDYRQAADRAARRPPRRVFFGSDVTVWQFSFCNSCTAATNGSASLQIERRLTLPAALPPLPRSEGLRR
jgi:DNA-directed RNA polymerase specialized sigma24 family protein